MRQFSSLAASRRHAVEWVRARLARGIAPEEILLLVPHRVDLMPLEAWLNDRGVPARILGGREQPGSVRLSTMHSAKSLDAACVLMLQAQQLPTWDDTQARRLLYIAMTRARNELCISYGGSSALLAQLEDVIARLGPVP